MPQQGSARPVTSFTFAPVSTSKTRLNSSERAGGAEASSAKATNKGKQRALDDEEQQGSSDGQAAGLGRVRKQAGGFKPLSSFAPAPATKPRVATPSAVAPSPRPLNPLFAPPPRPPSANSSSSAARLPQPKRQKRVLATEEEVNAWDQERGEDVPSVGKGKGRAVEQEELKQRSKQQLKEAQPRGRPTARLHADSSSTAKSSFGPLASTFGVSSPSTRGSDTPKSAISLPAKAAVGTPSRPSPSTATPLHRLSSFSPFPASTSTPAKQTASATAQTTPITRVFGHLPVMREEGNEQKPTEKRSILSLAPAAAPVPDAGADAEEDGNGDRWSPSKKGKKSGYLVSGIASRASALLTSAKTDQTLWLHDLSRSLSSLALPAAIPTLLDIAPPAFCLRVISFPLSNGLTDTSSDPSLRGGKKTLLAQCRLELDEPAAPSHPSDPSDLPPAPPRDLIGLVLFSLHSFASSKSSLPPVSPVKPRSTTAKKDDGRRSLHVPTNPHDLQRFIVRAVEEKKEVEVWVWEPFFPVDLLPEPKMGEREAFPSAAAMPKDKRGDEEGVGWDEELERKREEEVRLAKEADRKKKALVIGRFAVLV
ncbi:hypothetical protein JCM8547_001329 [Rhodosporidiobolus lusitaniae]